MSVLRFFQRPRSAPGSGADRALRLGRGTGSRFCSRTSGPWLANPSSSRTLRDEILTVIGKHMAVERDKGHRQLDWLWSRQGTRKVGHTKAYARAATPVTAAQV